MHFDISHKKKNNEREGREEIKLSQAWVGAAVAR